MLYDFVALTQFLIPILPIQLQFQLQFQFQFLSRFGQNVIELSWEFHIPC